MKLNKIFTVLFLWSANSIYADMFDIQNGIRFGLGFGYNQDYLNQSKRLSILANYFGNGGLEQDHKSRSALEDVFSEEGTGLSQELGGCPDTPFILEAPKPISGPGIPEGTAIDPVFSKFLSSSCSANNGTGTGASLNGFEIDLNVQYNLFPWLFLKTGFTFGLTIPLEYSIFSNLEGGFDKEISVGVYDEDTRAGDAVHSNGERIILNELSPSIENLVIFDSTTNLRFSGYHFQLPILIGLNLFKNDVSSFYFLGGVSISFARLTKEISSNHILREGDSLFVRFELENVRNNINAISVGLLWGLGGEYEIYENVSLYAEVRFLKNIVSNAEVSGTEKVEGQKYASDALEAEFIESMDRGSIAKPLQSASSDIGGNTTDILNLDNIRWLVGTTYRLF